MSDILTYFHNLTLKLFFVKRPKFQDECWLCYKEIVMKW